MSHHVSAVSSQPVPNRGLPVCPPPGRRAALCSILAASIGLLGCEDPVAPRAPAADPSPSPSPAPVLAAEPEPEPAPEPAAPPLEDPIPRWVEGTRQDPIEASHAEDEGMLVLELGDEWTP